MNRFSVGIYVLALIGIPWLGWKGFGPDAVGDTTGNGSSILAFWAMRLIIFVVWIFCLRKLKQSLDLLKHLPVLFTLDETGIKDRQWVKTPWSEFEGAHYNSRAWSLTLIVRSGSQYKNIEIKEEEVGLSGMDEIKAFMREHAPSELNWEH